MEYTNCFTKLVKNFPSAYIGIGNPNAKILIIGKEAALDLNSEYDQHNREIIQNPKQWLSNIENKVQPDDIDNWLQTTNPIYNPLYPYKGQFLKKRMVVNGCVRGKNGTSATWYNYQKLLNLIMNRESGTLIDFHEYCFMTELNEESAKKSSDNTHDIVEQSIHNRMELLKSPFYQQFPIVIVACGHYVRDYHIDIENLFDVICKSRPTIGAQNWINIHYQQEGYSPKLLIHTNQLSINISDDLLRRIAEECRNFISLNNITL